MRPLRFAILVSSLALPLSLQWTYVSRHAPQPAWPDPGKQRARVRTDIAYQPAAAGGALFFGSSADNKVYCLDAATGQERWTFFTGGPVRLAPALADGRVYVSCDDGWAYCLSAADGKLAWKFRAAPSDRKLLGNGRMISAWPMRTNVLVDRGVAYLCAGLFPSEGVYVCALRATDGNLIWKNDTCGQFFSGQPHAGWGGGFTGVSPQGPLVASADTLFVPTGRSVPAGFDRKTGRLLFWQGGTHRFADALFAVDMDGGQLRWVHEGGSIRNATIAIGDGRVFLLESSASQEQQIQALGGKGDREAGARSLIALDAKSGEQCWKSRVDLFGCVVPCPRGLGGSFYDYFTATYKDGVVLLGAGQGGKRLIAFNANDGSLLWSRDVRYSRRPLIVGDIIYAYPRAYRLRTGAAVERVHPVTGEKAPWELRKFHGCGAYSACPGAMFFRSASIGYHDLVGDYGTTTFGGLRPNCWISMVPANGVVIAPEASAGCVCSYPIKSTVVLQPAREQRAWNLFYAPGPVTPVRHLAINLGAPGDRRGPNGTLWLSYPRPPLPPQRRASFTIDFTLNDQLLAGGGYFRFNAEHRKVGGTEAPWLFASGCRGLQSCSIQLLPKPEKGVKAPPPARYTVRLGFDIYAKGRLVCPIRFSSEGSLVASGVEKDEGWMEFRRLRLVGSRAVRSGRDSFVRVGLVKGDPFPRVSFRRFACLVYPHSSPLHPVCGQNMMRRNGVPPWGLSSCRATSNVWSNG